MIERQVELAIEILKKGGVIIFPTDTVYGIGASPFIESAVLRVYQIKQRPRHSALPLLVARKSDLNQVANPISETAWRLAERFLPGGLTLILDKAPSVPDIVAPGGTVAVRIPDHSIPIAIIQGLGTPLIGTSANLTGRTSPVTAQDVERQLRDKVDLVIDGDRTPRGIASTIVDVSGDTLRIVREGAVPWREIEEFLGG